VPAPSQLAGIGDFGLVTVPAAVVIVQGVSGITAALSFVNEKPIVASAVSELAIVVVNVGFGFRSPQPSTDGAELPLREKFGNLMLTLLFRVFVATIRVFVLNTSLTVDAVEMMDGVTVSCVSLTEADVPIVAVAVGIAAGKPPSREILPVSPQFSSRACKGLTTVLGCVVIVQDCSASMGPPDWSVKMMDAWASPELATAVANTGESGAVLVISVASASVVMSTRLTRLPRPSRSLSKTAVFRPCVSETLLRQPWTVGALVPKR